MNAALTLWLATVLPKAQGYTLSPLPLAASFRRFYRVQLSTNQTLIAMDAPTATEDSGRFVRLARTFRERQLPVPEILAHAPQKGFVLMTDVGEKALEAAYAAGESAARVHQALAALWQLQSLEPGTLPPYTARRFLDEWQIFATWCVQNRLHQTVPPEWQTGIRRLTELILSQPTAAVHRDYHCQNLLLDAKGQLGIVDFQDALMGPALYDVASLLRDCYHRFDEAFIEQALDQYLAGSPLTFDNPRKLLDITALQRQLKAVGIFCRLAARDGKATHLKYVPDVLDHAQSVSARYEDTQWLAEWLADLQAGWQ